MRPAFLVSLEEQLEKSLLVGQHVQLVPVAELAAEEATDGLVKAAPAHRAVGVGEDRQLALVEAAGGHLGPRVSCHNTHNQWITYRYYFSNETIP